MTIAQEGDRIELVEDLKDPDPIPAGATGIVRKIRSGAGRTQLDMDWDPPNTHRSLMLIEGEDRYKVVHNYEAAETVRAMLGRSDIAIDEIDEAARSLGWPAQQPHPMLVAEVIEGSV